MGDIYGFNRDTVRRIGRMLREHESRISTVEGSAAMRRNMHLRTGNDFEFGFPDATITASATSGTAFLESGDVIPHTLIASTSDSTTFRTTEATTDTERYRPGQNLFHRAIGPDELVFLHRHYRTGRWLAVPQTPQCVVHFSANSTKSSTQASCTAGVVHCLWGPYADDDTITVYDPDPGADGFTTASGTFGRATGDRFGKLWIDWVKCVST